MKLLKYLFILAILVLAGGYFAANYILDSLTQEAITLARIQAANFGVRIDRAEYESLWISSPTSMTWNNLNVRFRIDGESAALTRPEERQAMDRARAALPLERVAFEIKAQDITAGITNISAGTAILTATNFSISPVSSSMADMAGNLGSGSVVGRLFETEMRVDMQDPVQSSKQMAQRFLDLARTGSTDAYIRFDGTATMPVRGSMVEANIHTEEQAGRTVVVVNREDIARISQLFDDKLTEPEIDIIAENPAKAPLLFSIKDRAETTARSAYAGDSSVPQDPYRHVLWSYLLTREFGPEFAKKVTDSHESGPTGNSRMERQQDYNNNEVGRRYAEQGVQESEILQLVRTDPTVMRQWNRGSRR
ncbi:MAG: hypothetical protein HOH43_23685 [Candidatus Latescibacteria bacterium]|jgi:hypothetical protein|nr:hypothetical protein [Candidatus Latescibacterota bacterium]